MPRLARLPILIRRQNFDQIDRLCAHPTRRSHGPLTTPPFSASELHGTAQAAEERLCRLLDISPFAAAREKEFLAGARIEATTGVGGDGRGDAEAQHAVLVRKPKGWALESLRPYGLGRLGSNRRWQLYVTQEQGEAIALIHSDREGFRLPENPPPQRTEVAAIALAALHLRDLQGDEARHQFAHVCNRLNLPIGASDEILSTLSDFENHADCNPRSWDGTASGALRLTAHVLGMTSTADRRLIEMWIAQEKAA